MYVVVTCLYYCPHAIQLILAPYNSVSAQVFSLTRNPVLVTLVTFVDTLVFLVYPVSRRYRPYVTFGFSSNGVWKVTLCVYGQLGRGTVCIPMTPDSPKGNEINIMFFLKKKCVSIEIFYFGCCNIMHVFAKMVSVITIKTNDKKYRYVDFM